MKRADFVKALLGLPLGAGLLASARAYDSGDFFRAIWINEVVINDIEIRPMGVHSLEFDDAGTATISFIALVPGRYTLSIPGSHGETQQAVFNIQ